VKKIAYKSQTEEGAAEDQLIKIEIEKFS